MTFDSETATRQDLLDYIDELENSLTEITYRNSVLESCNKGLEEANRCHMVRLERMEAYNNYLNSMTIRNSPQNVALYGYQEPWSYREYVDRVFNKGGQS